MIRGGGLFLILLNENSCQIYVVFYVENENNEIY